MNIFTSIYSRLDERTKLLIVAVLAFFLGGLLKGGGSTVGRYQACGSAATLYSHVLDTQKGTLWEMKGERYQEAVTMPW